MSYVVMAIFSEKLFNSDYESNVEFNDDGTPVQHKFTHAGILVWLGGLCCAIFGQLRSLMTKERVNPISGK